MDLLNCKNELEKRILSMEGEIQRDVAVMRQEVQHLSNEVTKLVSKIEFEPYRLVTMGLVGGVLIAALGAILAKALGW